MRTADIVGGRWTTSVLVIAVLACWLLFAASWYQTGWDFPVFYIAASIPLHGLYSHSAFATYWQQHLAPIGVPHWARFVRLPVFSVLLRPLSMLPYGSALLFWILAGLAAYSGSIAILIRRFSLPPILVVALLSFFPAIAGLISGQDNCIILFALTVGWVLLEKKRDWLAGLVFALCLYKFNLVVLIPVLLLLHKRFRALASFLITGTCITGLSFAITPLKIYAAALAEVPGETAGFFPFGLRGLTIVLGQDWLFPLLAIAVLLVCGWAMWRSELTQAFCIAITGGLLIVPYVCWYDSTLLAIPIVVLFARGSARIRSVCVAGMIMGPAWRYLIVHLSVEMFILAYFLHDVFKVAVIENEEVHVTKIGEACQPQFGPR